MRQPADSPGGPARPSFSSMKQDAVIAYYDGACPICVREMSVYERRGQGHVVLHDVTGDIPDDIDRQAALDALHVRLADGRVVTGWSAFSEIWRVTPGMEWLAKLTGPAPIRRPLDWIYRKLAPYRPRRKCADGACEL